MLLEFEKPIAELEAKLEDMKHLAGDSDDKVRDAIKALEKKIKDHLASLDGKKVLEEKEK